MIIVTGKSNSGKTSIVRALVAKHQFDNLITYTTRPMRPGEIQGKSYHFVPEEEFLKKVEEGFFLEWKKYETNKGTWYYGSAYEDYAKATENTIGVLTPDGIIELRNQDYDITVVYVEAEEETLKARGLDRGDDKDELDRRLESDRFDFIGADLLADYTVRNDAGDDLNELVECIAKTLKAG